MALPSSGTICIGDLKTEFSSSANCLTSYYRGGSIVPDVAINSGVPASGTICLTDFYGAANQGTIYYANYFEADNYDETDAGSVTAEAYLRLETYYTDSNYTDIYVLADINSVGGSTPDAEYWSNDGGTTTYSTSPPSPVWKVFNLGTSGYTVRYSVSNEAGDGLDFDTQYGSLSSLTTSAQSLFVYNASLPSTRRGIEVRAVATSGDGDETVTSGELDLTLHFEKSGSTTYTYTTRVVLQAEAISLGGQ